MFPDFSGSLKIKEYVKKTKYKGVEGMEVEYAKEKNLFNSTYRYGSNKYNQRECIL